MAPGKPPVKYKGTVSFADAAEIKKKTVRGLLRKRAKQYDSDSDTEQKPKKTQAKKTDDDHYGPIVPHKY